MKEDILAVPLLVDDECPPVLTHIIVLQRRERRIVVIMAFPCISDIQIKRIAITVEFPHAGNRHFIPCGIVISHGIEIQRTRLDGLVPVEFPYTAERKVQSVCRECR